MANKQIPSKQGVNKIFELAKKPLRCLEYIIAHEMIHLLERHHNERFLEYMNKYIPQWKAYKKELNRFPISHPIWEY